MDGHSGGWNDPNGLGWQVWRRTQSTGLLAQHVQRQLARLRIGSLSGRRSLASEIQRRFRMGGRGVWPGGDLPLFWGLFRWFGPSRWSYVPTAEPGPARRPTYTGRPVAQTVPISSIDIVVPSAEVGAARAPRWADHAGDVGSAWVPTRPGLGVQATGWPGGPAPERAPRRPGDMVRVSASDSIARRPNVTLRARGDAAGVPGARPAMALPPERAAAVRVVATDSGVTRADTPFPPVPRDPGGATRPLVIPSVPAARPNPPSRATMTVVHRSPVKRGTTRISRAIVAPWSPPAGLLGPGAMTSATAGVRSDPAPWPLAHDAPPPSGSAPSGREPGGEGRRSLTDTVDPGRADEPGEGSRAGVPPASRPAPSEPRVARAVFAMPSPAATGEERAAAGHDTATLTLRSPGISTSPGVGPTGVAVTHREEGEPREGRLGRAPAAHVLTVREGMAVSPVARLAARFPGLGPAPLGGSMGVSVRSPGGRSALALAGLGRPSVERPVTARVSGPLSSDRARSFSGPGTVPGPAGPPGDRAPGESRPGVGALARSAEPRFGVAVSSGSAEGQIERKATISDLFWAVDARAARPPRGDGGEDPILAARIPSARDVTDLGVSSGMRASITRPGRGGSPALSAGVAPSVTERGVPILAGRAIARRTAPERPGFDLAASSGSARGRIEREAAPSELVWTVDPREDRAWTGDADQQPTTLSMMPSARGSAGGRSTATPAGPGSPALSPAGASAPFHAGALALSPAGALAPSQAGASAPSPAGASAPFHAGALALSQAGALAPSRAGASALSEGVATFVAGRPAPMLVERAVARWMAQRLFGGIAQAPSASRFGAGWLRAAALVARSAGIRAQTADPSPDAGTRPSAIHPMEIAALGWGGGVTPVVSDSRPSSASLAPASLVSASLVPAESASRQQTAGPTTVFAVMRSLTPSRPPRMHMAEVPADELTHRAMVPAVAGGLELLLAARPGPGAGDGVMALQRTSERSAQAAAATPTGSAEDRVPVGAVVAARMGDAQAGAANAPIDLDELVDRAWQKLMDRVTIEQERRGYTRWSWQS